MKNLLLIARMGSSSFLLGQAVCVGTREQCIEAQRQKYASEPTPANFALPGNKVVVGSVLDESGARFPDGFAVQLRTPKTGAVLELVEKARSTRRMDGTDLAQVVSTKARYEWEHDASDPLQLDADLVPDERERPEDYPYLATDLDLIPQRLKPLTGPDSNGGAGAPPLQNHPEQIQGSLREID